jgi:hypothetical protein
MAALVPNAALQALSKQFLVLGLMRFGISIESV